MTALLTAAFAAGMVSTVNPCGFAMLPAYLGFFLTDEPGRTHRGAGTVALTVSAGFLAVFTVAGTLVGLGVRVVVAVVPWLALAVGIGLVVVGLAQLSGRRLLPYLAGPGRVGKDRSIRGMVVFGVAYAVASLSCTLPIFLSLIGTAVATRTPPQAVLVFVAYGLGMAIVVSGLTVLVAGGRRAVVNRIRAFGRRVDALSGVIMVAAGVFIVWYWATVLGRGAVALGSADVVRWIDRASAWITGIVGRNAIPLAVVLTTLVVVYARRRRGRRGADEFVDHTPPPLE